MQFERAYDRPCLRTFGIGGRVTGVPRVSVQAVDLGGSRPIAVYDDLERFVMGIDFSRPPEEIAAAMQDFMEESVTSGRWTRNDCRGHRTPTPRQNEETRGNHN